MARKTKRPRRSSSGRLNLRIRADLRERMHDYANRCGTTVTAIVIRHFMQLLEADQAKHAEAEQL